MSTRCFVSVKINDAYKTIYVHYDGYPSRIIPVLEKLNNFDEVVKFIEPGNRSEIDDFDSLYDKEPYVFSVFSSVEELIQTAYSSGVDYYYVYDGSTWSYGSTNSGKWFMKLPSSVPLEGQHSVSWGD